MGIYYQGREHLRPHCRQEGQCPGAGGAAQVRQEHRDHEQEPDHGQHPAPRGHGGRTHGRRQAAHQQRRLAPRREQGRHVAAASLTVNQLKEAELSVSEPRLHVWHQAGMTPVHLAARYGHSAVISEFVKQNISLRNLSRKLGMTALHIAAFYGEEDIVRELMRHVPPSVKSEVQLN